MELLSLIKRKSRNSSSDSSSNSPEFKRRREEQELEDLDILTIPEDAEAEQIDVVLRALHMAQIFASKADELLANLTQLDAITLQIKLLQNSVDEINATISASENKVALIKNDLKIASSEMNELKNSVSSLNKNVEEEKSSLEVFRKKTEEDHRKLERTATFEFWSMPWKFALLRNPRARKARTRILRKPCIISVKRNWKSKMLAGSNSNESTE